MSFDDLDNHIQFLHCHTASNSQQIPMSDKKTTTFMDTIVKTTLLNQKKMDDEDLIKQKKMLEIKKAEQQLMVSLTKEYYDTIKENLFFFANKGQWEMILHFEYSKFCTDLPGLGNPKDVAVRWLNYLTSPENENDIKKYCNFSHLNGLKYIIKTQYRLSKIVVHFTWM